MIEGGLAFFAEARVWPLSDSCYLSVLAACFEGLVGRCGRNAWSFGSAAGKSGKQQREPLWQQQRSVGFIKRNQQRGGSAYSDPK